MTQAVDYEAVKGIQQQIWSKGDFAKVAARMGIVAELLCEAAEVTPGERVLDVACGSGNTALAASRRFADVVGVDYVPALLEHGRERAETEGLEVELVQGDAEALPFDDAAFDVVLTTFGAMFAPDQPRAARELLRVCRPGGRIGMANWTPGGLVGELFAVTSKHAPPPVKLDPPVLWGTEERLRGLLGEGISDLRIEPREYKLRFLSEDHMAEFFERWFGPTKAAMERLDDAGKEAFRNDVLAVLRRRNTAGDRALVAPAEYLEVVATRSG